MRTTIDLPDDLLRRTKAAAALKGMKLNEFVAELLESGLSTNFRDESSQPIRRRLPEMIPAIGRKIPILSNAEIFKILDREEMRTNQNS